MPFQNGLRACNREVLLSDCNVDTDEIFALLVNDGVNSNSRLTCLAVTDDEFALTTSDGDHAIDTHQPGASKFYQLEIFHILQAIDAGDAILYRDHGTDTGR